MKTGIFIILFLGLFIFSAQATELNSPTDTTYIFLKDYGLYKTRKKNAIKHFYKALDDLKTDQPKILVFSTGTYHFYPDGCKTKVYYEAGSTNENPKVCAFHFENIKNLVIDGRGSHLIFHQEMQPFTFDNCQNITLKNMTIDWEQPFIAQAEVLRVTEHYMDIGLDPRESPYRLVDGKIFFEIGNGQQNEWKSTLEFDRKGRFIVPQTGEMPCLGEHWDAYHAEPTMPGIVRLHFSFERKPQIGNYLILQHSEPASAGVFITESKNLTIQNLRLYHSPGHGVLAQRSKDLTFNEFQAIPNRSRNRYFASNGNGLNIVNCSGNVSVNNCTFQGLANEAVSSENINAFIDEITSENDAEILDLATQLTIRNSAFKNSPGSGIRIATTGKVIIENNSFESSGSAILITSNLESTHRSSATSEVLIQDNIFFPICNSGIYSNNEAIITIKGNSTPANEQPIFYRQNIRIEGNQFSVFDYPLLFAQFVDGLSFNRNTVERSLDFAPFNNRQYSLSFEQCKSVNILNNSFSEDVLGKNIFLKKTPENQLNIDLNSKLRIEKY